MKINYDDGAEGGNKKVVLMVVPGKAGNSQY